MYTASLAILRILEFAENSDSYFNYNIARLCFRSNYFIEYYEYWSRLYLDVMIVEMHCIYGSD